MTGNFTVMQKSSVAPTVSPERSAEYKSLELLVENQTFLLRELLHPLNSRKAPTVSVNIPHESSHGRGLRFFRPQAFLTSDLYSALTSYLHSAVELSPSVNYRVV